MNNTLKQSLSQHNMDGGRPSSATNIATKTIMIKAPNLTEKAFASILRWHKKETAFKSIKQGWITKEEEKRALDRFDRFIQEYSPFVHKNDYDDASMLSYAHSKQSNDDEPINILCMDGGGMRGYGMIAMARALEKRCDEKDFLSRFDLIAGTSCGGCGSINCNKSDDVDQALSMCRAQIDDVRKNTLGSFNFMKLISSGNPVKKKKQLPSFLQKAYGDIGPLFNKEGLNAFALAARENHIDCGKSSSDCDLESPSSFHSPYLLRTYNLPTICNIPQIDHGNIINDKRSMDHQIITTETSLPPLEGTSDIPTWKAIGATAAIPVACDPVEYSDELGKMNTLVDGGILFNCPLVIALEEARRIYPSRHFGVVLSLGLNRNQDIFAQNAIDIARKDSPDLHYQRISPPLGKYSPFEKDESKLYKMEREVHDHVMNMETLDETICMLLESESRRQSGDTTRNPSFYIHNDEGCSYGPSEAKYPKETSHSTESDLTSSVLSEDDDDNSTNLNESYSHFSSFMRSFCFCLRKRNLSAHQLSQSMEERSDHDMLDVFDDDDISI